MHNRHKIKIECALYVVATPIGNLRDITLRALDVLATVDLIAAEDTRNTAHLLTHYGINAQRMMVIHQHNERSAAEKVIQILQLNQSVAFVSDAGTPAVSDPGALLVAAVLAAGLRVIPIPGANAAIAALSASGLTTPQFLFYGFLPNKSAARRSILESLLPRPENLLFYEAPHRILECVADLQTVFDEQREIVLAREVTKLFENIHRCHLGDALAWLKQDSHHQRGEFVVMIVGVENPVSNSAIEIDKTLKILLEEVPLKQAVQLAAKLTNCSKNELYQRALELKEQKESS